MRLYNLLYYGINPYSKIDIRRMPWSGVCLLLSIIAMLMSIGGLLYSIFVMDKISYINILGLPAIIMALYTMLWLPIYYETLYILSNNTLDIKFLNKSIRFGKYSILLYHVIEYDIEHHDIYDVLQWCNETLEDDFILGIGIIAIKNKSDAALFRMTI